MARRDPWVIDTEVGVVDREAAAAGVAETDVIAAIIDRVVGINNAEARTEVYRVFGVNDTISLKAEFIDPERKADKLVFVAEVVEVLLDAESEVSRLGETDKAISVKAEEVVSVIEAVEALLSTEAEFCTLFEADIPETVEAEDAVFTTASVGSNFILPVVVPKVLLVEASGPKDILRSIKPV